MFELTSIMWAIVIGSSVWVAYDSQSNKITVDNKPYSLNNGALAWFLSCILLWIIIFPYYLVKRPKVLQQRQRERDKTRVQEAPKMQEMGQNLTKDGQNQQDFQYCPNCGFRIKKEANFCRRCGFKIK